MFFRPGYPSLHTSNVSSCLRNGLKLYGIDDPDGCSTHYRKAASTLISMHKPELQMSLSQFMCHSRSTTERHYRHHMAHRGLYSTFSALASCQAMRGEESVVEHTSCDSRPFHPSLSSNEQDDDEDVGNHPDKATNNTVLPVDVCTSTKRTESDSPSFAPHLTDINCTEETALPKYSSKWNVNSIFHDQMEEDIFFLVGEICLTTHSDFIIRSPAERCPKSVSNHPNSGPFGLDSWHTLDKNKL